MWDSTCEQVAEKENHKELLKSRAIFTEIELSSEDWKYSRQDAPLWCSNITNSW